jgi:putative drug exporter of the RND superfamily
VVRGVILPACLALLGERAWYLPGWLSWLPGKSLVSESLPDSVPAEPEPAGPVVPELAAATAR